MYRFWAAPGAFGLSFGGEGGALNLNCRVMAVCTHESIGKIRALRQQSEALQAAPFSCPFKRGNCIFGTAQISPERMLRFVSCKHP